MSKTRNTAAAGLAAMLHVALGLATGTARAGIGDNDVGINTHIPADDVIDACVDLGVDWIRVDNNWLDSQPVAGPPTWLPALDAAVAYAVASGLEVFMTIAYTPAWASSGDTDGDFHNDVPLPGTYDAYVRLAVAHYRSMGVTHFGLWNEPNLDGFWEGDAAAYVSRVVGPGLAAIDAGCADAGHSDCVALGPELAGVGEFDVWLEDILGYMDGAGFSFDIYTHHNYGGFQELGSYIWDGDRFPEALDWGRFDWTRRGLLETLTATGHAWAGMPDREVWISETGYKCTPPTDAGEMATQASYYMLVIDNQLARPWYTNTFFYEILDSLDTLDGYGIIRRTSGPDPTWADNFLLKDAFLALRDRIDAEPAFQDAPCTIACCDGLDNDTDGLADMADPGCSSPDDDDESDDPPPPTRPGIEAPLAGTMTIDGSLAEWSAAPFTALAPPGDWVSPDLPPPSSATDLSARFAAMWDGLNLYLAVEVADDLAVNPNPPANIWMGDSVQVAFDMALDGGHAYDGDDDFEMGWARTGGGDAGYEWTAPASAPIFYSEFASAVTTAGLAYELAIPANMPAPSGFYEGSRYGFTILVNEDDGTGREGWIEWTPGIGSTKDPASFGLLNLVTTVSPDPDDTEAPPESADDPGPEIPDGSSDTPGDVPVDISDAATDVPADVPDDAATGGKDGGCSCSIAS